MIGLNAARVQRRRTCSEPTDSDTATILSYTAPQFPRQFLVCLDVQHDNSSVTYKNKSRSLHPTDTGKHRCMRPPPPQKTRYTENTREYSHQKTTGIWLVNKFVPCTLDTLARDNRSWRSSASKFVSTWRETHQFLPCYR